MVAFVKGHLCPAFPLSGSGRKSLHLAPCLPTLASLRLFSGCLLGEAECHGFLAAPSLALGPTPLGFEVGLWMPLRDGLHSGRPESSRFPAVAGWIKPGHRVTYALTLLSWPCTVELSGSGKTL